jgi:signal transduction histidine kinase/CheY-like chemotaxis protein
VSHWELNKERTIFKASEECFRLIGINAYHGFLKYIDLLAFLPRKEDRDNIEKGLISITNTDQIFQTDIKVKSLQKDPGENHILRFYAKWDEDEPGGNYSGIFQDISGTKKIEKELLKAKEKAERSDRLKSHFLTNLSYELRTPMNAILGFSELLSLDDLTIEQKLDYTKIIREKGNNLLSQIDEVIELSKFETGNITINKNVFELYPLLEELYNEYESKRIKLSKHNISLQLKVPEEHLSELIFTDPGRLQQMLSNLLSNAFKFTEKGEIEFGYKKSGKFFKFYVKDTGIGIEEEDQNLIFNRFHEVEETAAKKYGGSGLNLTISKHIVELLGGRIKVKSELNKGSRFQINIPVESPRSKNADMTEFDDLNSVNWKDRVILIAEDEDVNFRFLEAVLQKTQAQILRAKTGREAVELCKNISKVDLVLMDIKMPDMNGFDATKEIKKSRPLLPVIAQTAFAAQDELLKCEQSGCDDIITKPIDIKLLLRKINDLLT